MNIDQKLLNEIRKPNCRVEDIESFCEQIDDINKVVDELFDSKYPVKNTFLSVAIACGKSDVTEVLLKKGANPNFISEELFYTDCPPLFHVCIFTGKTPEDVKSQLLIAKALLEYGADPNMTIPGQDVSVYQYVKNAADLYYDTSSDYDYQFDYAMLKLFDASNGGTLDKIDISEILADFKQ